MTEELPPGYEEALVTKENVALVAHRAGKNDQDLRKMLLLKDLQGEELRVKYKVINDDTNVPDSSAGPVINRKIRRLFRRKK